MYLTPEPQTLQTFCKKKKKFGGKAVGSVILCCNLEKLLGGIGDGALMLIVFVLEYIINEHGTVDQLPTYF